MGDYTVIEAPSVLGLAPTGVERLAATLMDAGLSERLRARRGPRVDPPRYNPRRDPATGLLNPQALRDFAIQLADAVAAEHDAGGTPLVLGGDCSIILGPLLALRRRGRFGLLFLDGHADFYDPGAEPRGEAASMDLALATGRGPKIVSDLEGLSPLVRDEDVVHVGRRDQAEAAAAGSQNIEDTQILVIDLETVRVDGAVSCAERAVARLGRPELEGFWIHIDLDVIHDELMPAVDYRLPDGLAWEELHQVVRTALRTGRVAGVDITIFNPTLDTDGSIASDVVTHLSSALQAGDTPST